MTPLPLTLIRPTRAVAALLLSAVFLPAHAQAPAGAARIPLFDAAAITARCDAELVAQRALKAKMEREKGAGRILSEFNALELRNGAFLRPVYLLSNVATDKAVRDAATACVEKFSPFDSEVFQSRALFQRVDALKATDPVERQYRKDLLEGFEDSGASLPPAKRARAKAIQEELETLSLAFQKAINEDPTTITLAPADAAGLPESWIAARKRDAAGNLVLGLDYPTVIPFLQNATSEQARRKVWSAFLTQGGDANIARLDRALVLRHELAQLHGQPDYATFVLKRRMAATPQAVDAFLKRVRSAVIEGESRELAELRADKAAFLGKPVDEVKLERWDVAFHQERLRRARYAVDQEKLRAYFPTDKSVQFTLRLAERLYGIEFLPADVAVWAPDVRAYDVYDRADGKRGAYVGTVYLDLYPREGKYSHAAAFPVIPVSRLAGQKPASVLVTNFDRKGLNHAELETLLHEFGHALHGVLSTTRYASQAGTSVKRDFVEAPSQMFEEWARRPETLALFAEVCPECPRLNAEQIAQLESARKFGRGIMYGRQWQAATYDMQLHTGAPKASMPTWIALEQTMPLGYVEGTKYPAGFGHLLGGYAAGYYGYMWSEVLGLDMLAGFNGQLMDPMAGRRYRDLILATGGEREPQVIVEEFLGRKPNADAFFAEITGKR